MSTQLSNNIVYDANGRLVPQALVTVDDAVNPVFSTLKITGLTASTALVSDSTMHVISSTCTSAELAYVHGVTSAIQTQMDTKFPAAGGTITGNITFVKASNYTLTFNIGSSTTPIVADTAGNLLLGNGTSASSVIVQPANSGNATYFQPNGSITVNSTANVASAVLSATDTTRGFLPPRMTTTQRDAITSPAEGLQIWNTSTHLPNFYDGTSWKAPVIA